MTEKKALAANIDRSVLPLPVNTAGPVNTTEQNDVSGGTARALLLKALQKAG
jgi:hypothetical protein